MEIDLLSRLNRETWAGLAAINAAAVIFGSSALFGKLDVSPVWIVAGRAAFAATTLAMLALIRRVSLRVDSGDATRIAVAGVLLALHWVTFFKAVQDSGVAVATLTFAAFPLFTVLFESIMRRRVPDIFELASGLTIVFAVSLLVGPGLPATAMAEQGAVAGLLSAGLFAGFSIVSQRLGQKQSAIALSIYQNVTVVLFLLVALPFGARLPQGADWAAIAVLGVFATALMHQLYFFSLKRLPAAVCAGFVALEPVYAITFAAILFSEPIGRIALMSGVLIFGATLAILFRSKKILITAQIITDSQNWDANPR